MRVGISRHCRQRPNQREKVEGHEGVLMPKERSRGQCGRGHLSIVDWLGTEIIENDCNDPMTLYSA
jgi:hypothetical protein